MGEFPNMKDVRHVFHDGRKEAFDFGEIEKMVDWASESPEVRSRLKSRVGECLYDGITTAEINEHLIKTSNDLVSESIPEFQWASGRIRMRRIYKEVHGHSTEVSVSLGDHVQAMARSGLYDKALAEGWSQEDFRRMDGAIDHSLDFELPFPAVSQFESKYLVQDRAVGRLYETPQLLYASIAMTLAMAAEEVDDRFGLAVDLYKDFSSHRASLPTPILSGVRTPTRQFSSCVLIEMSDTLSSINACAGAVMKYASRRAGMGINIGRLRGMGARVRGGEAYHTGVISFIKYLEAANNACSQGGVRPGAATVFYPIWHWELESLLVLKNNKGTEGTRARSLDYGVQINSYLYRRMMEGRDVILFSTEEVPGLYEAFFEDQKEFARLYEKYEADPSIKRKKPLDPTRLLTTLANERLSTGRIYVQNVDNFNECGPFNSRKAPIRQSNLCLEIGLPTAPLQENGDGEVALCTLAAVNLGKMVEEGVRVGGDRPDVDRLNAFMRPLTKRIVLVLDTILSYQDYPLKASAKSVRKYRPLGVGVINFAYLLAANGCRYSDGSGIDLTHRVFEALQYWLLDASSDLAAKLGACEAYGNTTYAEGILPIDRYRRSLDEHCRTPLLQDWEALRRKIGRQGLRNATVSAVMPSEASSQVSNATNGVEPPRSLITTKGSKHGYYKQAVPDLGLVDYELAWDMPGNRGYLTLCAVMQKFVDQAVSVNTYYDSAKADGKTSLQEVVGDQVFSAMLGNKTLYYTNQLDHAGEDAPAAALVNGAALEAGCEGGACVI